MLGLSRVDIARRVVLPAALPMISAGLRVALPHPRADLDPEQARGAAAVELDDGGAGVVQREASWTMSRLLPDADLHVFARCGHWTRIERAAEFTDLVARFLPG
ncbi:alpha/beta fold hydrolase [Pseudonocardia abyssalis]|uniref:alpha/beta fold hydrolase n=1 Tax=Pseudonocardia abyssalis TaxID=2792008 RepID=UPI001C4A3A86|nr:hypothetical protein [Pseudonocardia abyssalis]